MKFEMSLENLGRVGVLQQVHEAVASINLALALVAFFFLLGTESATSRFFRVNVGIYRSLKLLPDVTIPKDNYTGGYFAFFIPAIVLASCLWLLLRLSCHTRPTRQFLLRRIAGIGAVAAPPAWWLAATWVTSNRDGWNLLTALPFYELVLVLAFVLLHPLAKWRHSEWVLVVTLLLHYGFWVSEFGAHVYFMGYGGVLAPTAGLCSGLVWAFYVREMRSDEGIRTSI